MTNADAAVHAFSDLAAAAYCPRQAYYRREDEVGVPESVTATRALAFRYPSLRDADDAELADTPIAIEPDSVRRRLDDAADRIDAWDALADPPLRNEFVTGRACHGIVHKVLDADGPVPSMLSAGAPPEQGVWERDAVRAVAAAKALAWETETRIERAFVEYPAHAILREVRITTHRRAAFKRALRAVDALEDDPPPRINDRSKCAACDYREECGVTTRSLRSLLSLGDN